MTLYDKRELFSDFNPAYFFYEENVKEFIEGILKEIDKSIRKLNYVLSQNLPDLSQANLSGGVIYLTSAKKIIKQKAGEFK